MTMFLVIMAVWLTLNAGFVAIRFYVTAERTAAQSKAFPLVRHSRLVNQGDASTLV